MAVWRADTHTHILKTWICPGGIRCYKTMFMSGKERMKKEHSGGMQTGVSPMTPNHSQSRDRTWNKAPWIQNLKWNCNKNLYLTQGMCASEWEGEVWRSSLWATFGQGLRLRDSDAGFTLFYGENWENHTHSVPWMWISWLLTVQKKLYHPAFSALPII